MKNLKFVLILMSFSFAFNSYARMIEEMNYDGISNSQSLFLSMLSHDSEGNYQQTKTEAKLFFEQSSREIGAGTTITVNMNGADIGMKASNDTNTLSLLKFKSADRWFTENTLNVYMEVDVRFVADLNAQLRPFNKNLSDLKVDDDFVSFTSGKIGNSKNLAVSLSISRKRTLKKDEVVFEKIVTDKNLVITNFGSDRSLVTIDLNQLQAKFERGKTHIVALTLVPNFEKWRVYNEGASDLFKSPEPVKTETDFRYSK